MISHKLKTIIIHIPKTGGSSIETSLGMKGIQHLNGVVAKESYSDVWDDYLKFTFVRNPWDRLVSIYHYYKFGSESENQHLKKTIPNSFKEFVNSFYNKENQWYDILIKSQKSWITDDDGELLVDYIARFEDYNTEVKTIGNKVGIQINNIPHHKKSDRGDYKEYYDKETIELVRNIFKEDIEYFNYEY